MDPQDKTYNILAMAQASVAAALAVSIIVAYALRPDLLRSTDTSLSALIMSLIVAGYFASVHQFLKKRAMAISTLILSGLSAATITVIVAQTGGLDSPYYIFWLLIIIIAGAFSAIDTLIVVAATALYFLIAFTGHNFNTSYILAHLASLIAAVFTGALVEGVYWRPKRAGTQGLQATNSMGKLSAEQLKAQVLMSQMGEGVIVVDSNRKIQLFNNAAQALTGWDAQSAQGIDYNLVLHLKDLADQDVPADGDPVTAAWKAGRNIVRDDLVMLTKAGRKLQLNISVSPLYDEEHQMSGGIILVRDVSHEKAVERQKNEFVSTASHEMRTPVAAIEGYISLAMNTNVATVDSRAMGFLMKAHDSIQHLGELFRDLLNVTQAEEGKLVGQMTAVNVTELVQQAVDEMKISVSKKSLSLNLVAAADQQVGDNRSVIPIFWALADPVRLREVVMNLIENAVKFTPQGSITVSMGGNLKELTISISDSGIGIAEEDLPHLFQKFYRVDSSATRTIGGTGLGLYLCRTIIELFNGRIWVNSKVGEGATFSFSLPRLSEEQVAAMKSTEPATTTAAPAVVAASAPTAVPATTPSSSTAAL